jgi:hypothetical protein
VKLGYYDTQMDNLTWRNMEKWIGGKVPQDRTIVKKLLRTVSLPLFITMCTISSVGIVVSFILIIFNVWNRHRRCVLPRMYFRSLRRSLINAFYPPPLRTARNQCDISIYFNFFTSTSFLTCDLFNVGQKRSVIAYLAFVIVTR